MGKKMDDPNFQQELFNLLLSKRREARDEATEKIVNYIKEKHKIFTIRNAQKPEMWVYQKGVYIPEGETYIKEVCRETLGIAFTGHLANEVVKKIEVDTYIDKDDFFQQLNEKEICLQNGLLNIETRELFPHTPEKIFLAKIPINYKPEADCSKIKTFLSQVLKKPETDILTIQEMFGYFLLPSTKFKKSFIFLGKPDAGKTTLIELMRKFIGKNNCSGLSLQEIDNDKFQIPHLIGKIINVVPDMGEEPLEETKRFKSLTGGDVIETDRKFSSRISFYPTTKFAFGCNKLPRIKKPDEGFWRRWCWFEFPFQFVIERILEENPNNKDLKLKDSDLIKKISSAEELAGLLNWSLKGLKRLLEKGEFSQSSSDEEVQTWWLRQSDSHMAFLFDCVEASDDSKIVKSNMSKAYVKFCKLHKLNPQSETVQKSNMVREYGTDGSDQINDLENRPRAWSGVKYKEEFEENPNDLSNISWFRDKT